VQQIEKTLDRMPFVVRRRRPSLELRPLGVARPTDGRQQKPEHGTFRNIPEQGKLSQNKGKKRKEGRESD